MVKVIDLEYIESIFKVRGREGHKGEFGHTAIFGGSFDYVGAPYFASEAAVKSGSGLVTLFVYEEILEMMKIKLNETIVKENPVTAEEREKNEDEIDKWKQMERKVTAIVFGSGMGKSSKTIKTFLALKNLELPLVIDADGLNILCESTDCQSEHKKSFLLDELKYRKYSTIITPHLGEFSRLSGKTISEIVSDRENLSKNFAKKHKVILVLKDSQTLITDGKRIYLNDTGNSSMSNGGMGDLLAGLIGSLISQEYSAIEAGILGTYILGRCGDELSKERFIVNPRDILEEIPFIMKTISSKCNC